MRRHQQPTPSSASSSDSDGSDIESCFDTGDEQEGTDAETVPTDVDTDVDGDDEADLPDLEWLAGEENAHPPEYYLDQENNSDESEDEDEDYSDGSLLLLDMIEGYFHRWVSYSLLACHLLPLFTGIASMYEGSCRGDAGRLSPYPQGLLRADIESTSGEGWEEACRHLVASTLGIYWKVFWLVYERATGEKIEGKMNRHMHRVLKKLAKKYRLSTRPSPTDLQRKVYIGLQLIIKAVVSLRLGRYMS
ncbi:hypothetical protein BKA65DRAFT_128503 [Rhexocercosporidium sp. MPI-PUGE-AT-0058]|nr:hypothetical protein BKA65DRAFT_128503 [Rhexocercosporidium sp. MPI-PUGE-AT-0058]